MCRCTQRCKNYMQIYEYIHTQSSMPPSPSRKEWWRQLLDLLMALPKILRIFLLFNNISISVGYLKPKTSLEKDNSWWDKEIHILPTGIHPQVKETLDYIAHSSVWHSYHNQIEAMHNLSAHQLRQYYEPQQVSSTAWTASVTWHME